jgi:ADP-heptose:LPS heptosyltransferase
VLVYRLGSLGDTVVALPALHLIARAFPQAERALLTNSQAVANTCSAASVLGDSGLIHRYFYYPAGTRNPRLLGKVWGTLRKWRPQVLIYLHPSRGTVRVVRDAVFFRSAGIRRITGLPLGDRAAPAFDAQPGRWEGEWHRLLRCLEEIGEIDPGDPAGWNLCLTESERRAGRLAVSALGGRPFVAAGVGSKLPAKDWGEDNWRELLGRITVLLPGHGLALLGAAEESDRAARVAQSWRGTVVNLCGTAPRVSAEVLSLATLFVGHDSGLTHLAAAAGTPCVAVYSGFAPPGQWYPYGTQHRVIAHPTECSNCGLAVCVKQAKKCILSITVEEVLAAVAELVSSSGRSRPDLPVSD